MGAKKADGVLAVGKPAKAFVLELRQGARPPLASQCVSFGQPAPCQDVLERSLHRGDGPAECKE